MNPANSKVLVLANKSGGGNVAAVAALKTACEVVEAPTIDDAMDALRRDHFGAVFSDSCDFLPLERALVTQQTNLILNTIGEGVCLVDGLGHATWMNKKMSTWPRKVHDKIQETCKEAFELFARQVSPVPPESPAANSFSRSKRYMLTIDDQQFMEMIASPVINPAGKVVQVVAVVWDATGTRRLQQKIDAIDRAGGELVKLEAESLQKLHVAERLKVLEDKIIRYSRELLHFDHFAIRLLDRKTNKLDMVMAAGFPADALNIDLFALPDGNGISGFVAATGRSYICPDVERDPRYVMGLDKAQSSLTVPLRLQDRVIGVFNVESLQRAAFNEDDRQFAEIFGRYVAMALNILNLLVVERVEVSLNVAGNVNTEVAGPLNDILFAANSLMSEYIGNDELRQRLQQIVSNASTIQTALRQAAQGTNTTVLGASDVKAETDPLLHGAEVLVADDEPNIRATIKDVLRKFGAHVTVASDGCEAIRLIEQQAFNLVLSDIKMPDKTGYEVFAAARKASFRIPVILMTGFGYDPNHSIVRASQEGLQAVLFKPFRVDQLISEVRKALQTR